MMCRHRSLGLYMWCQFLLAEGRAEQCFTRLNNRGTCPQQETFPQEDFTSLSSRDSQTLCHLQEHWTNTIKSKWHFFLRWLIVNNVVFYYRLSLLIYMTLIKHIEEGYLCLFKHTNSCFVFVQCGLFNWIIKTLIYLLPQNTNNWKVS